LELFNEQSGVLLNGIDADMAKRREVCEMAIITLTANAIQGNEGKGRKEGMNSYVA
jgi:hypothetical protein